MTTIFIDGQAGTTGLEISGRLAERKELEILSLTNDERKDDAARRAHLQAADIAILCLPDAAAEQAVALADGKTRILDASSVHRTHPDWAYGLAELNSANRAKIADAQFVSNPGCYPQGFILLIRPLIEAGLLDSNTALRCHAVSGYSGGGRQMVERYQKFNATEQDALNSRSYALSLEHKHVPEMQHYSGTNVRLLFAPMVANYYKGMLVHIPLFRSEVSGATNADIYTLLTKQYSQEQFIEVLPPDSTDMLDAGYLDATTCNGSNNLQLMLFGNTEQLILIARYDNLGKGAAGAAVQNLNIMLGANEQTGL